MTTYDVASENDLNNYINQANAAASGSFITLIFESDIALTSALNAVKPPSGVSLVIDGSNGGGGTYTLDTAGYSGLVVSGDTIIQNLTISNSMDNSAPAVTMAGAELAGTINISSNATISETAGDTFGDSTNSANVTNYGTYDIVYNGSNTNIGAVVLGIYAGNVASNISNKSADDVNGAETFTNYGTLEQTVAETGTGGTSVISVDVIDTGTLSVADPGGNEDLLFNGANNSFSGTYIGGGMIDYGYGTNTLGTIDMEDGACTTDLGLVNQNGLLTLSGTSTLLVEPGGTWNFTSDNGIMPAPGSSAAEITDYGTLAKTGGSGTTAIEIDFNYGGGVSGGQIKVATGTLAFNGPSSGPLGGNVFAGPISGAGIFSIGGGGANQIDSDTTITTGGWTINGSGTTVTLDESLTYSGTLTEQSGSSLALEDNLTLSNATFDGTVTRSGTAEIIMAGGANLYIEDLAGVVSGSQVQNFETPIGDFAEGDKIVLQGFGEYPTINGTSPSYNSDTNTTTLALRYDGSTVATLTLTGGNYSSTTVKSDPNVSGAVDVVFCFMPGTRIRTPRGDILVETLKRGDVILSSDGQPKPVSWIGRHTISTRFADPLRVLPIRIRAGALGDSVPSRDLLLSPDHAVLIDDILVQAGALVNGISIVRETNVPQTFTYYHVELDDHSLVLAENTPSETFINNVDRLAFDNWEEHLALYPKGKPIVEMPYARAKAQRQVPRTIREQLIRRYSIGLEVAARAVAA